MTRTARPLPVRAPRNRLRALLLAGFAAAALAGCTAEKGSPMAKAMRPLNPETVALIEKKDMTQQSPVVVRIFKEESELEVWKQTKGGDYALLKTYPICRWSGELGPKVKMGDRQAPEGFYTITPGQMNPNSSYYLSFNLGYPNAYDAAWGRTGEHLMVHGDCSSAGCYAMTDEQIQEIFALGRDSFQGGQRSFQVQAYPFRMTPANMARHRNNPNMAFWRMIKEGYDAFEVTKAPPKVDVCDKRYVFNAKPNDPTQRFRASEACPAYTVPGDIEQAVAAKERADDAQIASLAPRTPLAPVKTGADGGMHKVFLAQLENPNSLRKAPGSMPETVRPPGPRVADQPAPGAEPATATTLAAAPAPAIEPADSASLAVAPSSVPLPLVRPSDAPGGTRVATIAVATRAAPTEEPGSSGSGSGFLGGLTRLLGGGDTPTGSTGSSSSTAAAPASGGLLSGLSLGKLFGTSEAASPPPPAAIAAPTALAPAPSDAAVPLPVPRPAVAPAASAAPKPLAAAKPAAPASLAAAGSSASGPLSGPPILAPGSFSTAQ